MVLVGQGRAADWYRNLQAAPGVEVAIGRRRFRPVHRELDEHEGATVLADFERRNRWAGPVIRTVLSRLVGRHYDGSDEARHQLIKERPVLAFGPADKSST